MNRRGFFRRMAALIAGGVAAKALPKVTPPQEFTHAAYCGYYTVASTFTEPLRLWNSADPSTSTVELSTASIEWADD